MGLGGNNAHQNELTNGMVFKCEAAGEKTIPQLYSAGWRVIQYITTMGMTEPADPRAPPQQVMKHLILIEKI